MNKLARYAAVSLLTSLAFSSSQAIAVDEHYIDNSAAIGGYDVVSYHTEGKPALGSADFSEMYQGVAWLFSSAENQSMFSKDPAKYAPAYGGWCAAGASKGKKVPTKPDLWSIVDGQLYLNSSKKAHEGLFLAKTEEVIRKGESNWKNIFATSADMLK